MIPIETLKKVETMSALKILIYLHENCHTDGLIRVNMNTISDKGILSRNSVKKGFQELLDKDIIQLISEGKGVHPNTYSVSNVEIANVEIAKVDTPKESINGWKKATGSKAEGDKVSKVEHEQTDNIINNIIKKEFNLNNLLNNDINSLSLANENHKLNDEQLGKLARRVIVEWYLPLAQPNSSQRNFFPMQMKLAKDLLVMYRTEQVLAGIYYWTKVEPPRDGMKSLIWLKFERKKVSHILIALDHFKQEYISKQNEIEEESRIEKVETMKAKAIEIAKEKVEQKKKVDEMSDNDFLSNLLGGFGTIKL